MSIPKFSLIRNWSIGCWFSVGIGVLFAVLYWALGGGLTYKAQSWEEVPARILSVQLEKDEDPEKTLYSVRAEYEYEFRGVKYKGDRVSVLGGRDNDLSKHRERLKELEACRDSGELFRCFVDPRSPRHSVLYREVEWSRFIGASVASFLFVLVGVIGLYVLRRVKREVREEVEREEGSDGK